MSGFAGVIHRDGRPVTPLDLEPMLEAVRRRGPDSQDSWFEGPLGLVSAVLRLSSDSVEEIQPVVRGGVAVAFDGRLDERDRLLARLGRPHDLAADAPDASILAAGYERLGDRVIDLLEGDFALAVADGPARTVTLARDPMGVRPLYFAQSAVGTRFGSIVAALFANDDVSPVPNRDVLAEYLLGGTPRATAWDTFFERVNAVAPGVVVRVGPDGVRQRRFWAFDPEVQIRLRSRGDYVSAYAELFDRAVSRRLRSAHPVGVQVSGGLDSSSIFCRADRLSTDGVSGGRLEGLHLTSPRDSPGDEERYVRMVETATGRDIARIPMVPLGSLEGVAEHVGIAESPMSYLGWGVAAAFLHHFGERGCRSYLTGHFGDQVLIHQAYLVDLVDRGRLPSVARHLRTYPRWSDAPSGHFFQQFERDLVRWHLPGSVIPVLRDLRARHHGPLHDRPWFSEDLRRRAAAPTSGRVVGGLSSRPAHACHLLSVIRSPYYAYGLESGNKVAASAGLDASLPFLDRDLVAFLMAIPGEETTPGGVLRGIHRAAMGGALPDTLRLRRTKADGTAATVAALILMWDAVEARLAGPTISAALGLVDEMTLRGALGRSRARLEAGDADTAWAFLDMIFLEAWLERFVGSGRA